MEAAAVVVVVAAAAVTAAAAAKNIVINCLPCLLVPTRWRWRSKQRDLEHHHQSSVVIRVRSYECDFPSVRVLLTSRH